MVFSVVVLEVGSLLVTYVLLFFSGLVIFGMVQELFSETFLQVLTMTLMIKLNLVNTKNLVILQQVDRINSRIYSLDYSLPMIDFSFTLPRFKAPVLSKQHARGPYAAKRIR